MPEGEFGLAAFRSVGDTSLIYLILSAMLGVSCATTFVMAMINDKH